MIPSRGIILCHLDAEKISNLEKSSLPQSPFTKMAYQVRGCMAFRSNKLGMALIIVYFVGTTPYRTRAWPSGRRGMTRSPFSILSHRKRVFHFQCANNRFFSEAATES
jgi:hypothetical protein